MRTLSGYKEKIGITRGIRSETELNTVEIAELWNTYMAFNMYSCMYKYFLNQVEDREISALLESAYELANKRIDWIMQTFNKEGLPIPFGFSDEDVNSEAPRMYSDQFYLHFLMNKTRIGLVVQSLALTSTVRSDVRSFYDHCCNSSKQMYQKTVDLLVAKGLYIHPPQITTPGTTSFVKKQSFLAGYLTDRKRPLLAKEIASVFQGISACNFGKSILISFRQSAKSKQVRDYMNNGVDLMNKGINMFTSVLSRENIPAPMAWDTFVSDSTVAPFSDKLMMAKVIYINEAGLILSGEALANNMRHDLVPSFTRIMADVANYAENGVNLMIDKGWLEEPPRLIDREDLIKH